MRRQPASRGLTLIETMVVIAVLGILLALAAPSFRDFIATQRLKGAANELVSDMVYARSEALARQGKNAGSLTVVEVLWSGADYDYLIQRSETDENGVVTLTTLKKVKLDPALSLSGSTFVDPNSQNRLRFDTLRGMSNAGRITLSHAGIAGQANLVVNSLGMPSLCGTQLSGVAACQ